MQLYLNILVSQTGKQGQAGPTQSWTQDLATPWRVYVTQVATQGHSRSDKTTTKKTEEPVERFKREQRDAVPGGGWAVERRCKSLFCEAETTATFPSFRCVLGKRCLKNISTDKKCYLVWAARIPPVWTNLSSGSYWI